MLTADAEHAILAATAGAGAGVTPESTCRRTGAARRRDDPRRPAAYLEFAPQTAIAAGAAILPHFREIIAVEDKRNFMGYDPVTVADRAAEEVIRAAIKRAYPEHGIHGEEHGREAGTSPLTWVIDPIDGTKSFILGQLHWATLLALHDGDAPVVGIAHQPFVGETFLGTRSGIAQWRRGDERRNLRTRACARIEDAIVVTTDPRQFVSPAEQAALETFPATRASCATAAIATATRNSQWASSTSSSRTACSPTTCRR